MADPTSDSFAATLVTNGTPGPDTLVAHQEGEIIFGLDGADNLSTSSISTALDGGGGNDILYSEYDYSELYGGADDDQITTKIRYADGEFGSNAPALQSGNAGNDRLYFEFYSDSDFHSAQQYGGAGDDIITSKFTASNIGGSLTVDAGDGNDTVETVMNSIGEFVSGLGGFNINAGAGNDTVKVTINSGPGYGAGSGGTISAGSGDDSITLSLYAGKAKVLGEDGNDNIKINNYTASNDRNQVIQNDVDGGTGNDLINVTAAVGQSGSATNIVRGGIGNDHIIANAAADASNNSFGQAANILWGDDGNDIIESLAGVNGYSGSATVQIDGGSGDDQIRSDASFHLIYGEFTQNLTGGAGKDQISSTIIIQDNPPELFEGVNFQAKTTLSGGDGDDILSVSVDAAKLFSLSSSASTIENILDGGAGNDTLTASIAVTPLSYNEFPIIGHSALTGGDGNDILKVIGGDLNILDGGTGDDMLTGGAGRDTLKGGAGTDTAVFSGNKADYSIETQSDGSLKVSDLRAAAPDGVDTLISIERLKFVDITVNLETPTPTPTLPQSYVSGGAGADDVRATNNVHGTILNGMAGNDVLRGGQYNDVLTGGMGDDVLYGGKGADQFRFFGNQINGTSDTDKIYDLNFAEGDTLVFGSFGANSFADATGVNAFSGGTAAILSSYVGVVNWVGSNVVSASRQSPNTDNLLLQINDIDGQIQKIVISNGWSQYVAAGGALA